MTGNRARRIGGLLAAAAIAAAGCGSAVAGAGTAGSGSLPAGVMSAAQACRRVVEPSAGRSLHGVKQVRLVLTTYAKGEPAESGGDISSGMPPGTLVWVVAVHAKTVNVVQSGPPGYKPHGRADSYSVVMNARTGLITDSGVGRNWPLPLWKAGTVISLPPQC
jgi:hypothetical protein